MQTKEPSARIPSMNDIHAVTTIFGLNKTEAEIFEYLLQYGSVKAVELRQLLHLDRAPFYRAVNDLVLKDLIVVEGTLRNQVVSLQDMDSIKTKVAAKKQQVSDAEKSLTTLQASMRDLRDNRFHRENVEIFSGTDAYLRSMMALIVGEGKILRDITPDSATLYDMAGSEKKYRDIVRQVKAARLEKGISIKILFDNQAKNIDEQSASSKKDLKESRIFHGNLNLQCYLNTCGSRSLFYTKDKNGSWGILLKDKLITNLLESLFDVLWNQARPL